MKLWRSIQKEWDNFLLFFLAWSICVAIFHAGRIGFDWIAFEVGIWQCW